MITGNSRLVRQRFADAATEIGKIQNNEAGADTKIIKQCATDIRTFIGRTVAQMKLHDPRLLSAARKACDDVFHSTPDNDELHHRLSEFARVLNNIRTEKKKPRRETAALCTKLADWLLWYDEEGFCDEGRKIPLDTPFVENHPT